MTYALPHLGRQLADLPAHSRDHRGPPLVEPADGTPAVTERGQLTQAQQPRWTTCSRCCTFVSPSPRRRWPRAGKMIADPDAVFSMYPLVRTAAELSARVAWLLEPSLTAVQRVQRATGEQLDSLEETRRLKAPGAKDFAKERIRDVKRRAAAAGLTPERPPSRMESVSAVWSETAGGRSELGVLTYQLMAAVTHGTLYGLMRHVKPLEGDSPDDLVPLGMEGQYAASLGTDATTDAMGVMMALIPYNKAARRWLWWTGHQMQDWTTYLVYVASGFGKHLDHAPEDFVGEEDRQH